MPPEKHPVARPLDKVRELEQAGDEAGLLDLLHLTNSVITRRAAAKALANICHKESASPLAQCLEQETDRVVRLSLVSALGKLGDDSGLPALLYALKDREAVVRLEAAKALSRFNSETAFQMLLTALKRKEEAYDRTVRQFAAEALGQLADRRAATDLLEALKDEDGLVRAAAATALGRLGDRSAIPALNRIRHVIPHPRGTNCVECEAIDNALAALKE